MIRSIDSTERVSGVTSQRVLSWLHGSETGRVDGYWSDHHLHELYIKHRYKRFLPTTSMKLLTQMSSNEQTLTTPDDLHVSPLINITGRTAKVEGREEENKNQHAYLPRVACGGEASIS